MIRDDVFMLNDDCSNPVRLTQDGVGSVEIHWSSDGKRLAFITQPRVMGNQKVIVMDAEGTRRQEFKEGYHHAVSWTEDGQLLTTWLDLSTPKDRMSYLGLLDPATGLVTVLRKGINLGLGSAGWRPRKDGV